MKTILRIVRRTRHDASRCRSPPSGTAQAATPPTWLTRSRQDSSHTCAIATDHSLYCWGQNTYGGLGVGDNLDPALHPARKVGTDTNWAKVTTGSYPHVRHQDQRRTLLLGIQLRRQPRASETTFPRSTTPRSGSAPPPSGPVSVPEPNTPVACSRPALSTAGATMRPDSSGSATSTTVTSRPESAPRPSGPASARADPTRADVKAVARSTAGDRMAAASWESVRHLTRTSRGESAPPPAGPASRPVAATRVHDTRPARSTAGATVAAASSAWATTSATG